MGVGRFLCVGVPFGLTLASLICVMIAALAGVTDKSLDLFVVNTTNLSISSSSLLNLEDELKKRSVAHLTEEALNSAAASAIATATGSDAVNITASDLGLADSYAISLWGYCATTSKNTTCTKAKFNWAASALNTTSIDTVASAAGVNATLPKEVRSALKTFTVVSKWTEVVYIIAILATAAELVLGLFAICSRAGSCITWLISGFSSTAVIVASIMATVLASITVGSIESSSKAYGVKSHIDGHFLAVTWLAVAFSLASSFFWVFTICCCAADHHNNRKSRAVDQEKLIPQASGAYQRVSDPHDPTYYNANDTAYHGQQHGIYNPQHNQPVRGGAYEPYAHTAI